jgi:hypothetical protein
MTHKQEECHKIIVCAVNDYHHFDEPSRKSITILCISFTMAGADVSTLAVSITRCTFRNNMQAEYNIPAIIGVRNTSLWEMA